MVKFELKTQEDAYIFGYLWADGYIKKSKHYKYFAIEVVDSNVINMLKFKYKGTISARKRLCKETGNLKKEILRFQICNEAFYKGLLEYNFRKDLTKIPDNLLYSFFVGFLDGDGCIYRSSKVFQLTFVSKIEDDWTWFNDGIARISDIKFNYNIRSSWCKALNKTTYSSRVRITSNKALNFLNLIYSNYSGSCLERKRDKFLLKLQECNLRSLYG